MSSGGHGGTEFAEHLQDVCRIQKVKGFMVKLLEMTRARTARRLPEHRWHNVSQRQQRME